MHLRNAKSSDALIKFYRQQYFANSSMLTIFRSEGRLELQSWMKEPCLGTTCTIRI